MKLKDKFLTALKSCNEFVTVADWAEKVGELYPNYLEKTNIEAGNQKNETTGLREIAARLGSRLSTGAFNDSVVINNNAYPRLVKFATKEELNDISRLEEESDLEPITRKEIIQKAENSLEVIEKYRIDEFYQIRDAFKKWFGLDFEVDHSTALLNDKIKGNHHANNLQLLLKLHNGKKSKSNWKRFSFSEQVNYINKALDFHKLVLSEDKLNIDFNKVILEALTERLKRIY